MYTLRLKRADNFTVTLRKMTMADTLKLEEIQKEIKGFEKVDLTAKIQEFNNKKQELENILEQYNELISIYKSRIEEMLR